MTIYTIIKQSLCVLLPTFESKDIVLMWMNSCVELFSKYGIHVYLCDSSISNDVLEICKSFNDLGFNNVHYLRGETWNGNNLYKVNNNTDYKVFKAELYLAAIYDYVWLLAIGKIPDINLIMDKLVTLFNNGYDVIHVDSRSDIKENTFISYDNPGLFYLNNAWEMTQYGSSIVKSSFLKKMNNEASIEKYGGSCFLHSMAIFDQCYRHRYLLCTIRLNCFRSNGQKKASGWIINKNALKIFAKHWVIANRNLPDVYNSYKSEVILSHSKYTNLFGFKNCIWLRYNENITLSKVFEYKDYWHLVTKTPFYWALFLACVPHSFISALRCLYKIIH